LDGLPGSLGEKIAHRYLDHRSLAAEIATDRKYMDFDFRRIETYISGETIGRCKRRFVRRPNFHLIAGIYAHGAGMGLDVGVKAERRPKSMLENARGI